MDEATLASLRARGHALAPMDYAGCIQLVAQV
jgi:hypothetical protein